MEQDGEEMGWGDETGVSIIVLTHLDFQRSAGKGSSKQGGHKASCG